MIRHLKLMGKENAGLYRHPIAQAKPTLTSASFSCYTLCW